MVFNIKMDGNYTRKTRLDANGHKTYAQASITYLSEASTDSIKIDFLIADYGIRDAYPYAICKEKVWTLARK